MLYKTYSCDFTKSTFLYCTFTIERVLKRVADCTIYMAWHPQTLLVRTTRKIYAALPHKIIKMEKKLKWQHSLWNMNEITAINLVSHFPAWLSEIWRKWMKSVLIRLNGNIWFQKGSFWHLNGFWVDCICLICDVMIFIIPPQRGHVIQNQGKTGNCLSQEMFLYLNRMAQVKWPTSRFAKVTIQSS